MDPIISLEKFRRGALLEQVDRAVENYLEERSCKDLARELHQRYVDELTAPDCDIDDLYEFVNEYGDA